MKNKQWNAKRTSPSPTSKAEEAKTNSSE